MSKELEPKVIKGRGGKGGGASTPTESPNTLRSRNLIKFIDLIGEGEIEGLVGGAKGIYLDSTPLQNSDDTYNFEDFSWDARVGLPDQSAVSGFTDAESDVSVNAEVTVRDGPVIRQTSSNQLDAVRITIAIPALSQTQSNGDTTGTSVRFKISIKGVEDSDYVLKLDKTITGKCVSTYQESYRINVTGKGPYLIKVERVTPDSEAQTLQNKTYFGSYTEIVDAKFTYPNCAYVAITYNSDSLSGTTPTRSYIVKGLKVNVPSNYDPETRFYDGVWDGSFKLAYTNNPAWCLYDILINNRYGLGDSILDNQVDKFTFYTVGKYCDELIPDGYGGYEPRFTLNACISSKEDCYSLLNKMASVFRGMVYQFEQLITLSQDRPTAVSAIYTPANVVNGLFNYEGSSLAVRPTVVTVSYADETNNYEQAIETVQDDDAIYKYGWNQTDLSGFGCTSRGQAHRLAEWYLYTEQNEKEVVSFDVGLDSVFVKPGDVVRVVDPSYMGARFGGRIKSFTEDSLTLDGPVLIEDGASYSISYITKKGVVNTIELSDPIGSTDTVHFLNTLLTEDNEPQLGAMWSIESSLLEGRLYRVVSITESTEKNTFTISATQHEPTKYNELEYGLILDKPNYTRHTRGRVLPPTDLVTVESLYKAGSLVKTKLDLSWTPSKDTRTTSYQISIGEVDGNLQVVGTTSLNSYTIDNIDPNTYKINIETITPVGKSTPLTGISTVRGKTAPPASVQNLKAINGVDSVILSWDEVEDLDLVGYEVRRGNWDDNDVVVELVYGTTVTIPYTTAEKTIFCVKALDESGIYSETATSVEAQALPPADVVRFTVVPQLDDVRFDWDPVEGVDVQYQIREGGSWDSSFELITTKTTTATLLLPARPESSGEERIFWIKAVSPVGLWSENARYTTTILKLFEDRNQILHYNNATDTYDGISPEPGYTPEPYKGTSYNMEVVAGAGSYALYLEDGVTFGEHYFPVTLQEKYRARSWLSAPVIQAPLNIRWADANFRWESTDAKFQWYPTGDIDGVTFKKYLYKKVTDVEEYLNREHILYNFSMDSTLRDIRGEKTATTAINIAYEDARMTKGLLQSDVTKCVYRNLAFPVDGTYMFGFRIKKIDVFPDSTCLLELRGSNDTKYLQIGTYTRHGNLWVYCLDDSGKQQLFNTNIKATDKDFLYFGILQTSAKRTVYVYSTIRNIESYSTIDFTPTTIYDTMSLSKLAET